MKCIICDKEFSYASKLKFSEICSDECKKISFRRRSSKCVEFWVHRGHSIEKARQIISENQRKCSPRCIEYWSNKGLTIEAAKEKITEFQQQQSKKDKFKKDRSRSPRCIEHWVKKGYSTKEAKEKVSQFQTFDKTWYINEYGEEQGKRLYLQRREKAKIYTSLEYFTKKYGEQKGLELWSKKYTNSIKSKRVSKISKDFFDKIVQELPKDIKVYYFEKEFRKITPNGRPYMYDFVITSPIKFCIEFNGDFWHANPLLFTDLNFSHKAWGGKTVKDIHQYDEEKNNFLRSLGFTVEVVWQNTQRVVSDDVLDRYVKQILELIHESKKNCKVG